MIKSMTGYGKSILNSENRRYQIELKSVNHRYLDISIKLPRTISYLEEDIKKEISSVIKRGKIDVFVTFENNSQEGRDVKINKELAKLYIEQLKEVAQEENIDEHIDIVEIAKFPDVLTMEINQDVEIIKKEIVDVTKQAIIKLSEMKTTEGESILLDLTKRIDYIEKKIMEISQKSTGLIQEYVVKLEKRIKEIIDIEDLDKSRLAQEVVIYADKSSIEEEITRLKSHIFQFRKLVNENQNETVGKKLDFIIQEMNRETNTICSKAGDIDITNGAIEIKTALEDIREQIQNIE